MTTTQGPRGITVGSAVEVRLPDFTPAGFAAGMPLTWQPGVVEEIAPNGKVFDVLVRMTDGRPHRELVGPRGGGRVRKAA